jgi:hypothetical protein
MGRKYVQAAIILSTVPFRFASLTLLPPLSLSFPFLSPHPHLNSHPCPSKVAERPQTASGPTNRSEAQTYDGASPSACCLPRPLLPSSTSPSSAGEEGLSGSSLRSRSSGSGDLSLYDRLRDGERVREGERVRPPREMKLDWLRDFEWGYE